MRARWSERSGPGLFQRRSTWFWAVGAIFGLAVLFEFLPLMLEDLSLLFLTDTGPESKPIPSTHDSSPTINDTPHAPPPPPLPPHSYLKPGPYSLNHLAPTWPSWPKITHSFIFGDSWTVTGYELDGIIPTPANPFGNPSPPGSSSNGPNWIDYLIRTHNATDTQCVNLAWGGATVDMDLISPNVPHSALRSLKSQVHEEFLPYYMPATNESYPWDPATTLFGIWMGLNDIHNCDASLAHLFEPIFVEFAAHMDTLYVAGARNILLMNIPPIELAPLAHIINTTTEWTEWVHDWNANLTALATNFSTTYQEASVIVFDTYTLYANVMDSPKLFPETAAMQETHEFCWAYAFGAEDWDFKHENCSWSIDKYFWENDLHPTTQVHNMTAHALAQALAVQY